MSQIMVQRKPEVKVIEIGYEEWKPSKEVKEALLIEEESKPNIFFKPNIPVRVWHEDHGDELKLHIEVFKDFRRLEGQLGTWDVLDLLNVMFSYTREAISKLITIVNRRIVELDKFYESLVNGIERTYVFYSIDKDPVAKTEEDIKRIANVAKRIMRLAAIRNELEAMLYRPISEETLHDLKLIIKELRENGDI